MLPDQLLGESWRLQCQALACQQLGLEAVVLKAKSKIEKELLAAKDQLSVLKVERDSALEYLPLKEKAKSLAQQLSQKEVEHKSALDRAEEVEGGGRLLVHRVEKSWLEAQEMCQETLEVVLDQVSYLCPGVDFFAITLKTRWDPKGKRIYVPEELRGDGAEVAKTLPEVDPEQQQQEQGNTTADVRVKYVTNIFLLF
ncbi:hypothetical protein PIB30_047847 [Stylosanthes scabra]|uniref:Uncharacterized protein n=1 Tax=Stylosanthes scabra TaxID=79078 RepID=A0ABU6TGI7_9FABA|nr:hypothetical protein [Stylosanthes scabra]